MSEQIDPKLGQDGIINKLRMNGWKTSENGMSKDGACILTEDIRLLSPDQPHAVRARELERQALLETKLKNKVEELEELKAHLENRPALPQWEGPDVDAEDMSDELLDRYHGFLMRRIAVLNKLAAKEPKLYHHRITTSNHVEILREEINKRAEKFIAEAYNKA